MRKTKTKLTEVKIGDEPFHCVTWPKLGKGRNRRFFKSKAEAKTFLQQKLVEEHNSGAVGMAFTERQRAEYLECADKLTPFDVSLRDAVNFYLPYLQAKNRTCLVRELVTELLNTKEADGASARYLSDLRSRLTQFANGFDGRPVSEITTTDVDQWLRRLTDSET